MLQRAREQALRPQHENRDDDAKRERILECRRNISGEQAFKHADQQTAGNRSGKAVEAAEDRAGKGFQQDSKHHFEIQECQRSDQETGHHADRRRQRPGKQPHFLNFNSHELRGAPVHAGGAHRNSRSGVCKKEVEQNHHQHGDPDDAQAVLCDARAEHIQGIGGEKGRKTNWIVTPDPPGRMMKDHPETDGGNQCIDLRRTLKRPDRNALSGETEQRPNRSSEHKNSNQRHPCLRQQREADEGAEHRHLALREIDDVRGLVDEDE